MKILHIAPERGTDSPVARAVHGLAHDGALTWAQTPAAALQWLDGNRDADAVIVEVQAQSCASFVAQLRELGLTTPVVVVAGSTRLEPALAVLNSGADGYVIAGPSLDADLSRSVAAAVGRERRRRRVLAQSLTEVEAARERAERQLARVDEARRQAEQHSASELAAAASRLADLQARHSVSLARETGIGLALQQRLLELETALRKADERRASEAVSFAEQLAKRHAEFTASLAQAGQSRDAVAAELTAAMGALEEARQERRADAAAAAEQRRRREEQFEASLAEAGAARTALDGALVDAESAHEQTRQRAAADLAAANERQAGLEELLAQEADRRTTLERRLTDVEEAHQEAGRRHSAELTRAAAGLAELQARYEVAREENAAVRTALEQQKAEAAEALDRATLERTAAEVAAAGQLASREAELGARLAEEAAAKTALEQTLADAQAAQQHARQGAADDLAAAAARQAALEDRLEQETARFVALEQQLAAAVTQHAAAHAALEQRLTEAATAHQQEVATRTALEQTLADAQSAQQDAQGRAAENSAAAAARHAALEDRFAQETARGIELEQQLAAAVTEHAAAHAALEQRLTDAAAAHQQEVATSTALDQALAEEQSAHQHARQSAVEELAAAAARQTALEARLAQETARGIELERQLAAAATARLDTDRRHASELAAAAAHFAALQTRYDTVVTEHAAAYAALEQRLADAVTAHQQAADRAAASLAAASARETELVERLTSESDARAVLERDLTTARVESSRGRERSLSVTASYRRRVREQNARLAADHTGELRAKDEEIRQLQLEQETLQRRLGTTHDQLQHLHTIVDEERQAHEHARLTSESELHRVSAEYGQIRQSFDQLQSAFQTLEQIAGEHAAERTRLGGVVADRDSELSVQAERHRIAEQDARHALAELQQRLRRAVDTGAFEAARLQQEIDAARRELDATWTHAEALRGVAERVPDLRTELERSQTEQRRQFERAPYALCRCSESGEITDANHSFVALLGCRRADELRNKDFVTATLDSAGDLSWLLERARATGKTETVETRWKSGDGRRLAVRLQALATTTGSIDIVAEDITGVRSLEERLRKAQRMEAVGRLASEVAVTCDTMLSDVVRGAHEWLARVGNHDTLRNGAERLLADVTKAASVLRQLGTYGTEQERALEPVSARGVLRDLAPVLKRLVGDRIELVLPKTAASFEVDVDAERLERVFTNVAGYARERMPSGGQIRIDLATAVLGRRFGARYAHVRPGDHVLITVTELPAAGQPRGESERTSPPSEKPGVDLGVLAGLIASCGGHLWLDAQPGGNMVVKIHLPKPPGDDATDSRGGRLSRWLRSKSTANVRG